jgi:hypothetical protein
MAILNFPDTTGQPIDGSFTFEENGVLYSWDGYKWTANTEGGDANKYVEKAGDTMTGDLTVPSLNGGPLAGFRNQIINGDFRIWQRGLSFTNQGGAYTADRWSTNLSDTSNTAFRATTDIPSIPFAIGLTGGSSDYIYQRVELDNANSNGQFGVGTTWTASWYSTAPNGSASGLIKFYSSPNTPRNEWTKVGPIQTLGTVGSFTRYAQQYTVPERVGDCDCVDLLIQRDNSVTDWSVTGIQLEPGPVATPFEHRPIGTELALCQRYYFTSGNVYAVAGERNGVPAAFPYTFKETMRAVPTVTSTGGKPPDVSNITINGCSIRLAQDYISTNIFADAEL